MRVYIWVGLSQIVILQRQLMPWFIYFDWTVASSRCLGDGFNGCSSL